MKKYTIHSTRIDPFDEDLYIEFDVREVINLDLYKARKLYAQLTIAKIQLDEYIKILEKKDEVEINELLDF